MTKPRFVLYNKVLKWNGAVFHLELDPLDDVAILKHEIYKATLVKPERQKILNLKGKGGWWQKSKTKETSRIVLIHCSTSRNKSR
jgi:hypothetical protein